MKKTMLILMVVWVAMLTTVGMKAQIASIEKATVSLRMMNGDFSNLFAELPKFDKGTGVWSVAIALRSDVDKHTPNLKTTVPAVTLSYERSVGNNIGLGSRLGYNYWQVLDSKCQVHYYGLSVRGAYHLNISDRLDPYLGVALSVRGATMVDEHLTETRVRPSANSFIGVRYYIGKNLALFGEVGADMMGWFHFGFNFKI
ncbi:MAG: hypothetical protein JNL70_13950 [Saprospiraceae bacterium]|nr:hypothetical protein [Saprospiraceae bacterium]